MWEPWLDLRRDRCVCVCVCGCVWVCCDRYYRCNNLVTMSARELEDSDEFEASERASLQPSRSPEDLQNKSKKQTRPG